MTENEKEKLIRQYAAGEITCRALREKGFDSFLDVLAGLGELGLHQPVAPMDGANMDGPNVEARPRARALVREALKATP
ncbi:MAG TPA: hypothetical protein VME69_10755 [Methylocella sp.]|nr:hypothetical protein [Methylocella sp.]